MRRVRKEDAALVTSAVLILAATLVPLDQHVAAHSPVCILCGDRGGADFLVNIGLYVPFGMAMAARGVRLRWILLIGGLLSATVETAQIALIAGRDASLGDFLSNLSGSGVGGLIWLGWRRRPVGDSRIAALLPGLAATVAAAVLLLALALLAPDFPPGVYVQRWTPEFEHGEPYGGTVVSAAVGPLSLPRSPGVMGSTDRIRRLLEAGAPVSVTLRAGPPPLSFAPIFGIYARDGRELIMIGAEGDDLVYRYRPLGAGLRLDRGEIRFRAALAPVSPGATVMISVRSRDGQFCGAVDGRTRCVPAPRAGDTWALLAHGPAGIPELRTATGLIWLAVLFLPGGLLSNRWRDCAAAALVAVVGLTLVPMAVGLPAASLPGIGAALVGILIGASLRSASGAQLSPRVRRMQS